VVVTWLEREIMNGSEVLRIVDAIHRDKNIDPEVVFEGIELSIVSAARKIFGEESEVVASINRDSGEPSASVDGDELNADEIGELLGRIAAQTAKQVMIQKIREAERDQLYDEYTEQRTQIVTGTATRVEGRTVTVNLGKVEAILPRSEQIPGESHRVGERVRAIVLEVRKAGSRVKIILSRTHLDLIRRLFELEIPEVADHIIELRSLAREAGYRSKVAVSCFDNKIDAVGACVGVRGSRIRTIVDELAGERIDIIRWNDSLQVLVPNALQPAEVDDVILCPMLGKVIALFQDDQLSLAIGKKGQNVRLASKLVGWDIHVMNQEKLDEQLGNSVEAFSRVPEMNDDLAENLVSQGFFTFDDLSVIEPDQLAELGGLTTEQCDTIVAYADVESLKQEEEEKLAREQSRLRVAAGLPREGSEAKPASSEPKPASSEADDATTETEAEASQESDTEEPVTTTAEVADEEASEAIENEEGQTADSAASTEIETVPEPEAAADSDIPEDTVAVAEAETETTAEEDEPMNAAEASATDE
jgi:N utilization substance protein A